MTGSAQLDILPAEEETHAGSMPLPAMGSNALRQQAAERLAAHRQRRGRHGHGAAEPESGRRPEKRNRIADAVAERYAQSPSYRAVLAEEAEKAIRQAAAAAEVAARNAEAVATAQKELLAELDRWTAPQAFTPETATTVCIAGPVAVAKPAPVQAPVKEVLSGGLTVRLYEDLGVPARPQKQEPARGLLISAAEKLAELHADFDEALALDEEIAFRQSPVFETLEVFDHSTEPIAANLLEFPRQLVAARKARPRLAEGPLREESPRNPQLRIFEVEPEMISTAPAGHSAAPEWSSIFLDANFITEPMPESDAESAILPSLLPPRTAPIGLRLMAAAVDATLVLAGFVAFTAVAAHVAGQVPTGPVAGMIAAGTLAMLYLLYQVLFFSLTDQTPGMRYARIGLCTFTDENPSRAAMRRRIWAMLVAASPLGLGLLWVWLDDDHLGWHDRISRMYQRAY